ncbi:zinc fingers and homeoboxes protein 1 isoform X2 [Cottoperca gobio]|uniref:Zinc fingers and homeoboxes protein 1 n=1 Tax=Cottoperca gobio TaxID=56716 RepID=A0A6J2RA72_COTGO|nr:zinc fingers and homeoboxes protein 1-like isoform X2 [Cottoperca gobio]
MSSRRKSTTPCMVLPSDVVEQEEVEEKMERTKEEQADEEEKKVKEGAEQEPTAEELSQAVVVVPTPPDSDEPSVCTVEDSEVLAPSLKRSATNPPEDPSSEQSTQEQQCYTPEEGGADPATVAAISLSKTPIMRMKTKCEPKRIAVSLKSTDEAVEGFGGGEGELGGDQQPIEAPLGPMTPVEMLLHDSMKPGGGGLLVSPYSEQQRKSATLNSTVLPAGLAQVLSALQAQQSAAAAQPQLLIPLSSIPSYSAAMDTNPLLVNTYKKFPYPCMAEIYSLAAQTQFTEEQIKVWFSAQRLKHGVSWTPEEVEEARRKQFNGTVHTVPQTITVIPAHQLSAAANGLQSILQTCQIVGQPGLVFTQVGPGGHLPVTSPITLTVAGLPSQSQSSSRVSCQPTLTNSELKRATTVQPPSLSPQENLALSADTFNLRPKKSKEQLAELKASYLKNHFVTDAEISRLMTLTNLTKGEIKKWFSDTRYNQRNSKNSHVIVFHDGGGRGSGSCGSSAGTTIVIDSSDETPTSPYPPCTPPVKETRPKTWNPFPDFTLQKFKEKTPEQLVVLEESFEKNSTPSDEELSRLRTETKLTRREIDAWFTERRKMLSVSTSSPDSSEGGKMEEGGAGASSSSPSASSSRRGSQTPPGGRGKQLPTSSNKDMKDKNKKTPEQLHILKSAFVRTQWPTSEEYDQLAEESGLPRSYIVSWFGDSRYSWKNSNLKWFFQYQSGNVEGPNGGGSNKMGSGTGRKRRGRNRGWGRSRTRKQPRRSASSSAEVDGSPQSKKIKSGREILKEYYMKNRFLNEQDLDELVTKSNMSYEQVREWFAEVQRRLEMGADPFLEAAMGGTGGDEAGEGGETQGEESTPTKEKTGTGAGDEDDDEGDEDDGGDDTDDSEVWEPSRSVRKSLSVSED